MASHVAIWLVIFVVVYVVLVVVWLIWSEHEETKQDQERQRFERIMRSSEPPYRAMQSRKHNVIPRASGYPSRKVGN